MVKTKEVKPEPCVVCGNPTNDRTGLIGGKSYIASHKLVHACYPACQGVVEKDGVPNA